MQLPTKRYIVSKMNAHKAHSRLEFNGWNFQDVVYEDDGEKTTNTKYIHSFKANTSVTATVNDDKYLGYVYLDMYGHSSEAQKSIESLVSFYSEQEIHAFAQTVGSEIELKQSLILVGLSALCHPEHWKLEFLSKHIATSAQEIRMAALFAAFLALRKEYVELFNLAIDSNDQLIKDYAQGLLLLRSTA